MKGCVSLNTSWRDWRSTASPNLLGAHLQASPIHLWPVQRILFHYESNYSLSSTTLMIAIWYSYNLNKGKHSLPAGGEMSLILFQKREAMGECKTRWWGQTQRGKKKKKRFKQGTWIGYVIQGSSYAGVGVLGRHPPPWYFKPWIFNFLFKNKWPFVCEIKKCTSSILANYSLRSKLNSYFPMFCPKRENTLG